MRKTVLISLIVVFSLVAYLIFTQIFIWLFQESNTAQPIPGTPTAAPTFTVLAVATVVLPATTDTTATPSPSPAVTDTRSVTPSLSPTDLPSATSTPVPTSAPSPVNSPTPALPQVSVATVVNIRGGPGTNYPAIDQLQPNQSLVVVGKNEGGTWWQVQRLDDTLGWVAGSVVSTNGPMAVPVVPSPPPPPPPPVPAASPTPTPEPIPQYQYEPAGWYADTNYGLTRFLGNITDASGAPVNGVSVEAQCGDFRVISNPSGPVGWPPFYDSGSDPAGFYDLTLDTKPIPCAWILTVVQSPDGKSVTARLSDAIKVETTVETSIVTANWRKNW